MLSSHILGDIDRVCDRLLILNQGQLLFEGPRSKLENLLPESILELRVEGDVKAFRVAVLEKLGKKDLSQDGGRVRIEMHSEDSVGFVVQQLLNIAASINARIEAINSTGRRLEDAYLQLITEDEFQGFLRAGNQQSEVN